MLTGKSIFNATAYQQMPPKVCKTCGKTFPVASLRYAYKLTKPHTGTAFDWYCCYTCFRAAQKPREAAEMAHKAEMARRAAARAARRGEIICDDEILF